LLATPHTLSREQARSHKIGRQDFLSAMPRGCPEDIYQR
jgi:hypothetical protein